MGGGAAVPLMGMLDRSLLLRFRSCRAPTHSSISTLTTWTRSDSWRSGMDDRSACRNRMEPSTRTPQRPRLFQRPSRDAKVQKLRQQAAECRSLNFDTVDPTQQEGLTRRMHVFFKSLDDLMSYWEEEKQHKEQAFQLLLVPVAGMTAIRCATQKALTLLEARRYRCAYEALSEVRPWLPMDGMPPNQDLLQKTKGALSKVMAEPCEVSKIETKKEIFGRWRRRIGHLKLPARLFPGPLPVRKTFIHFDLCPEEPQRACSVPPLAVYLPGEEDLKVASGSSESLEHSLETIPREASTPSDTVEALCPSSTWEAGSHESHSSKLDNKLMLSCKSKGVEGEAFAAAGRTWGNASDTSLDAECSTGPSAATTRGKVKARKGCKAAKMQASEPVQASNDGSEPVQSRNGFEPLQSGNYTGFYRHEWTERSEKLLGSLKLLMRRFSLPCGDFQITFSPAPGVGLSFKEASHAKAIIKCNSKPAPEVILALRVGEIAAQGMKHDFSKSSLLLPKLDLWSAIQDWEGMFTVIFTVIVCPKSAPS